MKPWASSRDFRLVDSDGVPAGSDRQERTIARHHFEQKLQATGGTMKQFILDDRIHAFSCASQPSLVDKSLDAIPTFSFCTIRSLAEGIAVVLLNIVLTCPPLSPEDEEVLGPSPILAVMPAYRLYWVC